MADNYWEKRSIESIGRMESAVNGQLDMINQSFDDSRRLIVKEINAFYGRYARSNKISYEEATKILSSEELFEYKGDIKAFERLAKQSIGTFNLEVDNLSVQARIPRLNALLMQVDNIIGKLYTENEAMTRGTATTVFNSEYYHALFDIKQYTGFKYQFSKPATSLVQKLIELPIDGTDFSKRIWNQEADLHGKISATLNNMFVTGKPPQYFADQLQKQIGAVRVDKSGTVTGTGKKYEAYRLLYTESAHVTNQAQLQACGDDNIDEYEILATLDKSTCDECDDFDERHYPLDKAVEGENCPPFHCFCRCTTAPYIPELAGLSTTRVARGADGKTETVSDMNYDEWAKEKGV